MKKHKAPHQHNLPVPTTMPGEPGGRIGNPIVPDGNLPTPMGAGMPTEGSLPMATQGGM